MASPTYPILLQLVTQFETLSQLVVVLINTHVTDQQTIEQVTREGEALKAEVAEVLAKAKEETAKADDIVSSEAEETDLATRFSVLVDNLISQASAALPASTAPAQNTPVGTDVIDSTGAELPDINPSIVLNPENQV